MLLSLNKGVIKIGYLQNTDLGGNNQLIFRWKDTRRDNNAL